MNDRCHIPRCRTAADLTYIGHGVCERHWNQLTADDAPSDALRMALGIDAAPAAAMEKAMEPTSTSKTSKTEPPAEATSTKKKASKKTAPPKEPKPKREKVENPVVFAFRLSEADRTRIHEAAGPAGATRFVRSAALAAATGDAKTFEALVTQAKSNAK